MKTVTVKLYIKTATNKDAFNHQNYTEEAVDVPGCLYAPSSAQEILDATNLYGKTAVYTLAIPKGDTHVWEDAHVKFAGEDWHVFGIPLEGIEGNIPLAWNKKVTVERYE